VRASRTIELDLKVLLEGGGVPTSTKTPRVFVAFRMNDPASIQMRTELADALLADGGILVDDGRVAPGLEWAPTIRKRIKTAKLVVADVSGPSRDVLFELGFAAGKHIIQVVPSAESRDHLPRWMTSVQTATYLGTGTATLSAEIVRRIESKERLPTFRRPSPLPDLAVWLTGPNAEWAEEDRLAFLNLASEKSLRVREVNASDIETLDDLKRGLNGWLLVVPIDGQDHDYLGHFAIGDVAARLAAGAGHGAGESMQRLAVILVRDTAATDTWVADSVRRVPSQTVSVVHAGRLCESIAHRVKSYQRWLRGHHGQ
jgi:hypothetical protein